MKNNQIVLEMKEVSTARLKEISLQVYEGDFLTVIGPSGAGKSSILMLLNRLEDPQQGEILYRDKPITTYKIPELRQKIGMVFQTYYLFPGTIEDNLKFGPSLRNEWRESIGITLLNQVQLPSSYINKDVSELSGGEKQRVALARTLANQPDLLLLDEPTSALDNRTVECIEKVLVDLVEKGMTIMMVTHDLQQAKRLGQRTVFIKDGKIVEIGLTKELFLKPKSKELSYFLRR